jgi:hypothetical protein
MFGSGKFGIDTGKLGASSSLGPTSASVLDTGLQGVVSAKVLTSSSHHNADSGGVTSKAALVKVSMPMLRASLGSAPTASVISSECRSTRDGVTASSNLADLNLGKLGDVSVATPNMRIGVPGLAEVIANEQIRNADGSLTVNALDIKLLGGQASAFASGSIVLASSTCGTTASLPTPPPVTNPPTTAPPSTLPSSTPTATSVPPTSSSPAPSETPSAPSSSQSASGPGGKEVTRVPIGAPETGDGTLATVIVS